MQKADDEIHNHKKQKKFLDLIAIMSKNKEPKNQKKRKYMKAMRAAQELDVENLDQAITAGG